MTLFAHLPLLEPPRLAHGLRHELRAHGVHHLVLDRPQVRNAFDPGLRTALLDTLAALAGAPPRLLILSGAGPIFCAGADLAHMAHLAEAARRGDAGPNRADAEGLSALFRTLAAFPAPTLALVRGAALGGGLGLVACCDLVVAEAEARFATSEVRLGLVPGTIGPYVLRRLGPSHAAPLLLSGARIDGREAHRLGLVHRLALPGEDLEAVALHLVRDLLQAAPGAARRTKALMLQACPLPGPELEAQARAAIVEARETAEGREGLGAFLEKRSPAWVEGLGADLH